MDNNILLSVIIPAYNAENTLNAAIDSLLNQTLKDIEIIVVDDGSTDSTKEIICEYINCHENIKGILSQNKGVSAARNAGIDIAQGEYIAFLDADDLFDETMLEKMYSVAKDKGADVVQCGRLECYLGGNEKSVLPNQKLFDKSLWESPSILGHSSFIWDKIYNSSIIKEYGIRLDETIKYAEENMFILQILLHCKKVSAVREPLYIYNARRPGTATFSFDKRLLDNPKGIAATCDVAVKSGMFGVLEGPIWALAKGYYFRRVNDFTLYNDKELQKGIVDGFFALFDQYFWEWRDRIIPLKGIKRIFSFQKKKYTNKKKMYAYINSSHVYKILIKAIPNAFNKIKHMFKAIPKSIVRIKNSYKDHKNGMRYTKYLRCNIDPKAVLLSSNSASIFNGNIYYMAKSLLEKRRDLKVYVVSNNVKRDFVFSLTDGIRPQFVRSFSKEHLQLLATAKFLASNTKMPTFFIKRPEQVYMNTWHGTPLKTLGKSMHSGKRDMALNQKEFFSADYLLYPNEFMMEKMMADFELNKFYRGNVLLAGYPRNSAFYDSQSAERIRGYFGLNGKRVYVYMPTWRGESISKISIEQQKQQLETILEMWDESLNENIIVFVKLHPYVMRKIRINKYNKIRPFPENYETYSFLNASNGLITDYSSVFFDFANSRKEILLYTYDKDEYIETRGLYFNIDDLPFPQFDKSEDLIEYINQNKSFCITEAYNNFIERFCKYDCLMSPEIVTNFLVANQIGDDQGKVINYSAKIREEFRVIFMPDLNSWENKDLFSRLAKTANEDTIFAFFVNDVTGYTDRFLNSIKDEKFGYIVVPGEMVMTAVEIIKVFLYRKFHFFKKTAKKVYRREIGRIFPNITIKSFENYSACQKFKDISELFSDGTLN